MKKFITDFLVPYLLVAAVFFFITISSGNSFDAGIAVSMIGAFPFGICYFLALNLNTRAYGVVFAVVVVLCLMYFAINPKLPGDSWGIGSVIVAILLILLSVTLIIGRIVRKFRK